MNILLGEISTDDQHMCDVFVIMPFKDNFREVYDNVIKDVCNELGLDAKLGDDFFSNRQIINEIWSAINNCNLVIADCSERNPNVFYELGIAHTLNKTTITITQNPNDIPFDISGVRYIEYTDSIVGSKELSNQLREAIQKTLNLQNPVYHTLLKTALARKLRSKDNNRFKILFSDEITTLKEEVKKARQLKEYDWMELFARAWIQIDPKNQDAYEDLGTALIRARQPKKAIPVGEKLIELNKLNYDGYSILGRAFALLGEYDRAREWQEIALKYSPPTFRQYVMSDLVEIYVSLGLLDEAIETLEEFIPIVDLFQKTHYEEKLAHLRNIKDNS